MPDVPSSSASAPAVVTDAPAAGALAAPRAAAPATGARLVKRNHWIVRLTHWVNAIALPLMVGSGLQIFYAYPAFARKGETFCCYPVDGHARSRRGCASAAGWPARGTGTSR